MGSDQRSEIKNFTIGKNGFGNVVFLGKTDVNHLDLDNIIKIKKTQIIVYPNIKDRPKSGEGLNKPAEITLSNCFPVDKKTKKPSKDEEKIQILIKKLKISTKKFGGEFIDWKDGNWIFKVQGFDTL